MAGLRCPFGVSGGLCSVWKDWAHLMSGRMGTPVPAPELPRPTPSDLFQVSSKAISHLYHAQRNKSNGLQRGGHSHLDLSYVIMIINPFQLLKSLTQESRIHGCQAQAGGPASLTSHFLSVSFALASSSWRSASCLCSRATVRSSSSTLPRNFSFSSCRAFTRISAPTWVCSALLLRLARTSTFW